MLMQIVGIVLVWVGVVVGFFGLTLLSIAKNPKQIITGALLTLISICLLILSGKLMPIW